MDVTAQPRSLPGGRQRAGYAQKLQSHKRGGPLCGFILATAAAAAAATAAPLLCCSAASGAADRVPRRVRSDHIGTYGPQNNSLIYNGIISPLSGMMMRGLVWDQGEANVDVQTPTSVYACRFGAMLDGWRELFGGQRWAAVFVQLSPYGSGNNTDGVTRIRLAQAAVAAGARNATVGMAVTIDLGDPKAPFGAIHSRRKEEVAHRVALQLARIAYNGTEPSSGPQPSGTASAVAVAGGGYNVTVPFTRTTGSSMLLRDTDNCTSCCANDTFLLALCASVNGTPPTSGAGVDHRPRHRSCTPGAHIGVRLCTTGAITPQSHSDIILIDWLHSD